MSGRATNLVLLVAVPALVLTGLLSWAYADPLGTALVAVHRAAAAALLIVLAWKYGIAQRSVRRRAATGRAGTVFMGAVSSVALLLTLGLGLAWTLGAISFDRPPGYSLLNIHVIAGVALVPLVVAHSAQRRWRVAGAVSRRDVLRGAGALAGGVVLAALLDRVDPTRRATGSREASVFPVTAWTFDAIPSIDTVSWTVEIVDGTRTRASVRDLVTRGTVERDTTLDCTGGWASTQRWSGVPLRSLVPSGRGARVTSLTGHTATFTANEIGDLLLATHVAGTALSVEHGAPVRLVAPRHRGYAWIKWVNRIEVL